MKIDKIKPVEGQMIGERIFIDKPKSNIITTEEAGQPAFKARVVSEKSKYKVGQSFILNKDAHHLMTLIHIDNMDYLIIHEGEIRAIVND